MSIKTVQRIAASRGYSLRKTRGADEYALTHKRTGYPVYSQPERAWVGMGDCLERILRRVP